MADTLNDQIIEALRQAQRPLGRRDLLPLCPLAADAQDISIALNGLKKKGQIEHAGTGCWQLAADPPAGGNGEDNTPPPTGSAMAALVNKHTARTPAPAEREDPLISKIQRLTPPEPLDIHEPERKARALRALAEWPALDAEIARYIICIAHDMECIANHQQPNERSQ